MRLAEIRCETCRFAYRRASFLDKGFGWCRHKDGPGSVIHADFGCTYHPLWQQALAEEEKISATAEKGGDDETE